MTTTHANREPERLLTTRELADRLGLTTETIRQWARCGTLPVVRLGRRTLRFDPLAIDRFLSDRLHNTDGGRFNG